MAYLIGFLAFPLGLVLLILLFDISQAISAGRTFEEWRRSWH